MSKASEMIELTEKTFWDKYHGKKQKPSTSKKKLFQLLDDFFKTDKYSKDGLSAKGISDETYGKESYIYVRTESPAQRKELEDSLTKSGFKVNKNYWPGSSTVEVRVSYFKGWHHDESKKAGKLLTVLREATGKKKYTMNKTYETWDEDSVEAGDTDDRGFEYEDKEFDSIWAMADEIRDAGATEPSDSRPSSHTWYSTVDPEYSRAHIEKGEDTYYSFHPNNLTQEEAQELYDYVTSKNFPSHDPAEDEDEEDETDDEKADRLEKEREKKNMKLPGMESFREKKSDDLDKVIEYDVNELDGLVPTGYYGDIKNILTFLRGNEMDMIASAFIRGMKKGNLSAVYIDSRVGSKPVSSSWSNGKVGKKEVVKALDRLRKVV